MTDNLLDDNDARTPNDARTVCIDCQAPCCFSAIDRVKLDDIHQFIGELKGMLDGLASNPMLAAFLPKH